MFMLPGAIIGHLVGDYLLQNDWMAQGKKQSSFICAVHCLLWTLAVCVCGYVSDLAIMLVLFVTHFLQDRTNIIRVWMDFVGQKQFATGVLAPWSIIVVDNVWHLFTIYLLWRFTF